jgi:hypothetical protein
VQAAADINFFDAISLAEGVADLCLAESRVERLGVIDLT